MDVATARTFALTLPGTTEEPHFEMLSFRVGGKIYATYDAHRFHVFVGEERARELASDAFEELWWGKKLLGVRVRPGATDEQVRGALEEAWRRRAPKRLLR